MISVAETNGGDDGRTAGRAGDVGKPRGGLVPRSEGAVLPAPVIP